MIISCPACQTRFNVPAKALGEAGRKVRCANCGDSWHQMPEEDAPPPAPAPAPAPSDAAAPEPTDPIEDDNESVEEDDNGPDVEAAPPAPEKAKADGKADSKSARRAKSRAGRAADDDGGKRGWVGWLVLILVLAGIGSGGFFYQGKIVELWPPAGQLYDMIGLSLENGDGPEKFGLSIQNVKWEHKREKGKPVLVVKGEVTNTSEKPQSVPRLRVIILDDHDRRLFRWTVTTAKNTLEPSEATKFSTRLANPPDGARSLAVTFQVQP